VHCRYTMFTIKMEFRLGTAPSNTGFAGRGIRLPPRGTLLARVSSIDLAWTGFGDQPAGHGSPAYLFQFIPHCDVGNA
jgi:hypothetical protein